MPSSHPGWITVMHFILESVSPPSQHITPILASLHWLPVHFRVHFKILLFVFKSLNGLAPLYLSELLHPHTPAGCLRSADLLLLEVLRSKRKLRGDRAFSVPAPKLWKELPLNIRQASSLSVFKTRLKTHFHSLAFNPAWDSAPVLVFYGLFVFNYCFIVFNFIVL